MKPIVPRRELEAHGLAKTAGEVWYSNITVKIFIVFILAAGTLIFAGCSSTVRTLEYKDGRTLMTENAGDGSVPRTWELKEASSPAEKNALRKTGWKFEGVLHHAGGADTFLMKRKLSLQTAAPPAFRPMLITTLGSTNISPDGIWQVVISAAGDSVDVSYKQTSTPLTLWSTISVPGQTASSPGWKAHAGWFAFIESESRVWVYDGDRYLCLVVDTPGHGSFYHTPQGFPCAVPAEVFSRLPESVQKEIQTHG